VLERIAAHDIPAFNGVGARTFRRGPAIGGLPFTVHGGLVGSVFGVPRSGQTGSDVAAARAQGNRRRAHKLRANHLPEKSAFALRENVLRGAKGDTYSCAASDGD
jgi:hypothetical protein